MTLTLVMHCTVSAASSVVLHEDRSRVARAPHPVHVLLLLLLRVGRLMMMQIGCIGHSRPMHSIGCYAPLPSPLPLTGHAKSVTAIAAVCGGACFTRK